MKTNKNMFRAVKRIVLLTYVASLSTLMVSGCGQKTKEEDAAKATSTATPDGVSTSAPAPAVAPKIFIDAGKQASFEKLFDEYKSAFVPPAVGTPVRIYKANGLRVEGEMMRYNADGIVISTPDGMSIINKNEMTEESKESLFVDQFSRAFAEQHVNQGKTSPQNIFIVPDSLAVDEVRRFTADRMNARVGPGRHFAHVDEAEFFRGQNVFVVGETNGWICVKASADADQVAGWIPKYASFVTNPEDKDTIKREVEKLIENGFLIDITPARNEALIDLYEWRIADSASAEGMSRLLAFYCGHQKGSRLFWVDVKDALSGRRLAEYSESKGFKVH